jgi:membrane carboxypeptidase/penicillin-binding protein PbpC
MGMFIAFDTLDYVKRLEKAGVPSVQAEQQSMVLAEFLGRAIASLNDLAALEQGLNSKIDSTALKLERRIDRFATELSSEIKHVKWMLGMLMAINIAIALKVFLR